MSCRAIVVGLLVITWLAACGAPAAGTVRGRYPAHELGAVEAPATLVIAFTHAASGVIVSVDGEAVVSDARGKRVIIEKIPAGEVSVMLAADGGVEKAFRVVLAPGQRLVVPVAAPAPPEATHPLTQALVTVAVYAAYLGLQSLF